MDVILVTVWQTFPKGSGRSDLLPTQGSEMQKPSTIWDSIIFHLEWYRLTEISGSMKPEGL